MTLFDFEELAEYWAEHPPVHILVAVYLGFSKFRRRQTPTAPINTGPAAGSNLEELLAELGSGFGAGDVHAGLDTVVLDFAELRRRAGAVE
jgi:hypothetical protein